MRSERKPGDESQRPETPVFHGLSREQVSTRIAMVIGGSLVVIVLAALFRSDRTSPQSTATPSSELITAAIRTEADAPANEDHLAHHGVIATSADHDLPYVGPDSCAECHASRVAEFRTTNHFRTCRQAQPQEMPSAFSSGHATYQAGFPNVRFEMTREGDEFRQTTIRATPTGEERTASRIDLILGAGSTDDVYLSWSSTDRITELPISWLWPFDEWGASHFCQEFGEGDFSRAMTVRCMECHTTWLQHEPGTVNVYRKEKAILGVTCEKCHGPARDHIAFHRSHPETRSAHAIIQPAKLDRERLIETCTQCHSNATIHRQPPFSYRPGERLSEYFRTLEIDHPEDDHVANQIRGLEQSRCFTNSSSMTCITCHDPHGSVADDKLPKASCAKCHTHKDCPEQPRLPTSVRSDCTACHLPARIKMNVKFETETDNFVPATHRSDHRIAVHETARDEVLLRYYRGQSDAASQAETQRLESQLSQHWVHEAQQLRRDHRFLAAIGAARESLAVRKTDEAQTLLRELVRIQTRLYRDSAEALLKISQNHLAEAIPILQRILDVSPNDVESHSKLGTIYAMTGQKELAIPYLDAVARLDPNNGSGYGVLGRIAYRDGQFPTALQHWSRAEECEPRNAQILLDLGQTLLQLNRPTQAIEKLTKARNCDPTRVDILNRLVSTLEMTGRTSEAIDVLTAALAENAIVDSPSVDQLRQRLLSLQEKR